MICTARDRRLAVGVEQLGAVADDAAVLLIGARQEPGDVHEGHERHVEGVARAHESCGLLGGLDVQAPGEDLRLVPDDPDDVTVHPRVAAHDVHGPERVDLEELAVVDDVGDHVLHVVGLVGCVGHETWDRVARALGVILGLVVRRVLEVVRRAGTTGGSAPARDTSARRRTRTSPRRTSTRGSPRRRVPPG